jgi:hypothetical protein
MRAGATPVYVWVDGVRQIPLPPRSDREGNVEVGVGKDGEQWSRFPEVPDWEKERKEAIEWEGLPPLTRRPQTKKVVFVNVREVWRSGPDGKIKQLVHPSSGLFNVIVEDGKVKCVGDDDGCRLDVLGADEHVNLEGGSVSPGLMTFGSRLGLEEIQDEPPTGDGSSFDAFTEKVPAILNDPGAVVMAVDGLVFGTRHAL